MKTIHIDLLDSNSIKSAVYDLREVKDEWKRKAIICSEMIATMIADQIDANLGEIPWTDDLKNTKTHEVIQKREPFYYTVIRPTRNGYKVVARGKDLVFVEFGAGIYHNGAGGQNPLATSVHFDTAIGSYGKGQGANKYWFVAHNLISCGTPAYMPIQKALETVKPQIPTLVRQVFV